MPGEFSAYLSIKIISAAAVVDSRGRNGQKLTQVQVLEKDSIFISPHLASKCTLCETMLREDFNHL